MFEFDLALPPSIFFSDDAVRKSGPLPPGEPPNLFTPAEWDVTCSLEGFAVPRSGFLSRPLAECADESCFTVKGWPAVFFAPVWADLPVSVTRADVPLSFLFNLSRSLSPAETRAGDRRRAPPTSTSLDNPKQADFLKAFWWDIAVPLIKKSLTLGFDAVNSVIRAIRRAWAEAVGQWQRNFVAFQPVGDNTMIKSRIWFAYGRCTCEKAKEVNLISPRRQKDTVRERKRSIQTGADSINSLTVSQSFVAQIGLPQIERDQSDKTLCTA